MTVVREYASTCARHIAGVAIGASLTGCAFSSGQSSVTTAGAFLSAEVGAVGIDVDDFGGTLEVEEDTGSSIQIGFGYQANRFAAVELRVGDFGTVEFNDDQELTYQVADISGLLMRRRNNATVFARLGVGSFHNDGDFDVDLESPVHVVVGGGLTYHAMLNLDLRLTATAHGSDALVGSAGIVWRFGTSSPSQPRIVTTPTGDDSTPDDEVSEPIESVTIGKIEETVSPLETAVSASRDETSNGLVIDEKPVPELQTNTPESQTNTIPEPTVPDEVTAALKSDEIRNTAAPKPKPTVAQAPTLDSEFDAVNSSAASFEKLFVVDTLLDVKPLQFNRGAEILSDRSAADLNEVVTLLKANPSLRLQVESHAAPVGSTELNMLLSRRRALTVIRLLIEQGISADRLKPRAFGDTAPLADATSIGNNDRVEFRIR